jgi:hypothetical protein
MAIYDTVKNSIHADGQVIRKEVPIFRDFEHGVVACTAEDGERAAKGEVIAKIYESIDNILAINRIRAIQTEVEKLSQLNLANKLTTIGPDVLSKQTNDEIRSLISMLNNGNCTKITENIEKIFYLLNERQIITNQVESFDARLQDLLDEEEKWSALCKNSIQDIRSPLTGSFVNYVDGDENRFNYESVLELTPEDLRSRTDKESFNENLVIGKIISESRWYIAFILNGPDVLRLRKDMEITISIPSACVEEIPAKVVCINQKDKASEAVVICMCDQTPGETFKIRNEKILLNIENFSGIKIPKSSLHKEMKKATYGVFVLQGNKLVFKEVNPIYVNENYVICEQNPDSNLKLYDQVVVEGTDLYDGKIIR